MTTLDANSTAGILADDAATVGSGFVPPPQGRAAAKNHGQPIGVSPAVLDAARKDGDALLREVGTSLAGLSEAEAEERARASGPNEIAQERKQGWPIRILKIIRNPLVILLALLSAVSFLTGDARARSSASASERPARDVPTSRSSASPSLRAASSTAGDTPMGWR